MPALLSKGDSPLSITASITGILTFVTAVIASMYVQYRILKNVFHEMWTIMKASIITFEEAMAVRNTLIEGDNRPEVAWMRKHLMDLHQIEKKIISRCSTASGTKIPAVIVVIDPEHDNIESQFDRRQEGCLRGKLSSWIRLAPESQLVFSVIQFVLLAGVTPTLFRWYG